MRYRPLATGHGLFAYAAIVRRVKANLDAIRAKAIETTRRAAEGTEAERRADEVRKMLAKAGGGLISCAVVIEDGYARIRLELFDDCRLDGIARRIAKAIAERRRDRGVRPGRAHRLKRNRPASPDWG